MNRAWSWADVVERQADEIPEINAKVDSNLSICPKIEDDGQVDRSVAALERKPEHIPKAYDFEDFDERAAIIEANGIPKAWAEGYVALCTMPAPTDYALERWRQLVDDCGHFLDRWGREAAALGWMAVDAFGVHPAAPVQRYDGMGLVTLLAGRKVCDISAHTATIDCGGGVIQTFQRCNMANSAVALWLLK
ncbi:MAG: hypothetical protein WBK91_03815 [Alphaproteobacteria bacterium]